MNNSVLWHYSDDLLRLFSKVGSCVEQMTSGRVLI
jgi:hypothetical protein